MGLALFLSACLSILGAGELVVFQCFLCLFLGTSEEEWCCKLLGAGGAVCTDADVLGAESDLGSKAGLGAASMRTTFSLAAWSFCDCGLKLRQNWQQSFLCPSPKHLRQLKCGSLVGIGFAQEEHCLNPSDQGMPQYRGEMDPHS